MKEVDLKFEKTITKLAGNQFGRVTYENQVKDYNYVDKLKIIFPKEIDNIASSFIQGFFSNLVKNIGITGIEKQVEIISDTIPGIKNYIIENLV